MGRDQTSCPSKVVSGAHWSSPFSLFPPYHSFLPQTLNGQFLHLWVKGQGWIKVMLMGSYNTPSPALNTVFLLMQGFRWYNGSYCIGKVRKPAHGLQWDYNIWVPALKKLILEKLPGDLPQERHSARDGSTVQSVPDGPRGEDAPEIGAERWCFVTISLHCKPTLLEFEGRLWRPRKLKRGLGSSQSYKTHK